MAREIIFRGRKIELALDPLVLADGTTVPREVVVHPGAVAILPLPHADHVCLLRNHRFSVGQALWEIPAGTLEPGEAIDAAARRELAEETGYHAARWRKLAEFYPSPGILTERMYLFLAELLTPGPMQPERDERLEPQVVPWTQALAWTLDGTIQDAKTLVAVLLWDRLRAGSAR
jgi:ADP-ribose pyrophosphatase